MANNDSFLITKFRSTIIESTVKNMLITVGVGMLILGYYIYSDVVIRPHVLSLYTRGIALFFAMPLFVFHLLTLKKCYKLKFVWYNLFLISISIMMFAKCLVHLNEAELSSSVTGTVLVVFIIALELKTNLIASIVIFFLPLLVFTFILHAFFNPGSVELVVLNDVYPIVIAGFTINRINYKLRFNAFKSTYLLENERQRTEELYEETVAMNEDLNTKAKEAITHKEQIQEANEALKESNATKDKFFAIIAHDLKSPFNSILGFARLLHTKFDTFDEAKIKRYVHNIYHSSNSAYKLLENLLIWAQAQNNSIDFKPERLNLLNVLGNAIDPLMQAVDNKSLTLLNLVAENINVVADKNMLETVLRNILSNAIKFTPKGGDIVVNAQVLLGTEKSFVQITVDDTGVGISEDKIEKLFEVSKNNSTKGTDNEEGTGLGLILCKDFVEKNGGSIKVESQLGKGTSFILTLPE